MGAANRKYDEKRSFRRMKVDTPVKIKTSTGNKLTAICKDLSGAGMLLEMDHEFPIGTELDVHISPSSSANTGNRSAFSATTEVARVKSIRPGTYTTGLMIKEIYN